MIELLNIDCMTYMAKMPDKAFDLAIVDPPYGVGNFSQNNKKNRPHSRPWAIDWNNETPGQKYFDELKRVSINYIVWGANYYKQFLWDCGSIIWDKGNSSPVGSMAEIACTNLFNRVVIYYEKWTGFINSEQAKETDKIHPCQKPIKLYRSLLKNYAKPGDKILDTHGGSMSSAIACHEMGFDLTLCEIDLDYYNAGVKRVENAMKQQTLFNYQ